MTNYNEFGEISPCDYARALTADNVMDIGIRPLWDGMPRVAGPAYTVRCGTGDNLMLHAAIYRAEPGSVIVVQSGDLKHAVAGGNVCATAHERGIAAFIIDGVIRDIAEIRELGFPVFARGLSPIPGTRAAARSLNQPIVCGGIQVLAGDVVVADEEGIVVIPQARMDAVLQVGRAQAEKEATQSLASWQENHRATVDRILREQGFDG